MNRAKRDFLIIIIGKLLQVVLMLAVIKVSTKLLGAEDMGNVYMVMTFSSFFVLIFLNPIGQYIQRHLNEWKEQGTLSSNILYFISYITLVALLSVLVMMIYIKLIGVPVDFSVESFLLLLPLHLLFTYLNVYLISLLNLLYFRISFIVLTLLTATGVLLFGYLFVYFLGASAENWLYGLVMSNLLFTIAAYILLRKKIGAPLSNWSQKLVNFDKHSLSSIISFVIPLAFASIFMWLQQSGYRVLIEQQIGLEFLGFLGIGLLVAGQVSSVIESIILQYFYPIYYQQISNTTLENRTKAINDFINKALPIYFILTLFVTFLAKYIVEALVDEKFFEAYVFTVFGIWVEFFRMTSNLFGNVGQSEMQTKKLLIPYSMGSLTTIALVYVASLSPDYQLYIPMALVMGSFSTMLLMYIEMQKLLKFTVNYKLLLFALALSVPFTSVLSITVDHSFILSFSIVIVYGLYFLGAAFLIYKKGLKEMQGS